MKNTKYNILVLQDERGEHRQFRVSKYLILSAVVLLLLTLGAAITIGYIGLERPGQKGRIVELEEKLGLLEAANERYHQTSLSLEEKLERFEEKATKLAEFVGVEITEQDGIGGPDIDAELNPYLRYDLGLMDTKMTLIETRFDELENVFREKAEMLDSTPSILPTRGWISSGFKMRIDPFTKKRSWHNGIDISAHEGTPVYAPARGVVTLKGYQGGFGNMLVISHGNGIKTRYGHLHKFNVTKGQRVERGDLIAYVGNTGRSTAPHLHYEVHQDDKALNPMKFIIREAQSY